MHIKDSLKLVVILRLFGLRNKYTSMTWRNTFLVEKLIFILESMGLFAINKSETPLVKVESAKAINN